MQGYGAAAQAAPIYPTAACIIACASISQHQASDAGWLGTLALAIQMTAKLQLSQVCLLHSMAGAEVFLPCCNGPIKSVCTIRCWAHLQQMHVHDKGAVSGMVFGGLDMVHPPCDGLLAFLLGTSASIGSDNTPLSLLYVLPWMTMGNVFVWLQSWYGWRLEGRLSAEQEQKYA